MKIKIESLKDRLLRILTYENRGCDKCCRKCNGTPNQSEVQTGCFSGSRKECRECEITVKYEPEKGSFVCDNGHEYEPRDFFFEDEDYIKTFEAILYHIDEFTENEIVLNEPEMSLPLLIGRKFRFESSKDFLQQRLKGK